jgi:nucleoside-diphosphate-sugar epimerase
LSVEFASQHRAARFATLHSWQNVGRHPVKARMAMRVLVAGASGVLGQPAVRQLLEAGHEVVGLARDGRAEKIVRGLGAESVRGDLLDQSAVSAAARGAEAIVNLSGSLPVGTGGGKDGWELLESVWRDGTRNLLRAGQDQNVQVFLQASLGLLYGDQDDAWVTEETPLAGKSLIGAARDADRAVEKAGQEGLPVVTLRLGTVYSPDAWHTRLLAQQARQRSLAIVGDGKAYWSLIHAEDAAQAVALAVDDAEAGAVYNVADDRPTRMSDLLGLLAELSGAPAPSRVPALIARAVLGADVVALLTTSVRLSNRAIKQDLELALRYPTCEEGLRAVLSQPVPDPD